MPVRRLKLLPLSLTAKGTRGSLETLAYLGQLGHLGAI